MTQYAIIENGVVTNVIEADATFAATVGAVLVGANGMIGSAYANGVFTLPVPPAPPVPTLAEAQAAQVQTLTASYEAAIAAPVSCTSKAGVAKTYQADPASVSNLQNTLLGLQAAQATPTGFYWVAADNTQVLFTYADLQALAAAMLAQGWAAFQKLQTLKAEVAAATTVTAVQAVTWA